ncbi:helix-turn-helix domain-containing protein [Paenibacillus dendritiformis]|uniref:helix-turn-helix domain-containing protein n=1 Tax=Paenibacillus TaxID=44249 RepID=UPI0013F66D1E|nr:helix-turn-helix domain-containing protein [Paenibacillus thiaminolyticus]NGP60025.1 helix-turn-helix domain-containing protein [Paenibacillus thiaminolyticus]
MSELKGTRIREIRKALKRSGTEVANKLGISSPYYYDIEKGKRNLNAELAVKLAEIFGVSVDYLLGVDDTEPDDKNELEFLRKLDLSDKELLEQFDLQLDGVPVTDEEAKNVIAFLRTMRQMKRK